MTGNRKHINYTVFTIMGISFIGIGIIFMLAVNTVVGITLVAAGMGNMAIGLSGRGRNKS